MQCYNCPTETVESAVNCNYQRVKGDDDRSNTTFFMSLTMTESIA